MLLDYLNMLIVLKVSYFEIFRCFKCFGYVKCFNFFKCFKYSASNLLSTMTFTRIECGLISIFFMNKNEVAGPCLDPLLILAGA